jgi:aldehyde dehydrogenase (NAD+)
VPDHTKIYIDGSWIPSEGKGTIEVTNPVTEEIVGTVPEGTPADVDKAVIAARKAFDTWGQSSVDERVKVLQRLQESLSSRMGEIAEVIISELGMPAHLTNLIQVGLPLGMIGSYIELAQNYKWEEEVNGSLIVREPVGVVGAITPWNFPLHQITCKLLPAITAGCTMVVKPSEVTPLTAFALAEILDEIDLPPGVFNLVTGYGPVVGEAIAGHPDIDMVSFTGSTRAGKRVSELASQTVKRVALELGGKSPFIVLDDADLEEAVSAGVSACYLNSGQTCSAWTRMLVPRGRQDEAAEIAGRVAESFTLGAPDDSNTRLGPLVSATQRDRVRTYIKKGLEEGATIVTGGPDAPDGLEKGYFVRPTVFKDVSNDMTIAREEIFGPVLSIIPYDSEDDAIRLANDTIYGLHGGVFSADRERAQKVARRLRAGNVDINGQKANLSAPFGGYKQSGNGREWGEFGLEEYLEVKSLNL